MSEYPPKLKRLVEGFQLVEDRSERVELLIGFADRFLTVPEEIAKRPYPNQNRVPECESEAYVFAHELPDHSLKFHFAVENRQGISAMAVAVILDETLSGQALEQVAGVDPDFVYEIFGRELSTGKGLGLTGIVSMVKRFARRALEKQNA